jgi:3-dehydroquinate dehydratase-2
VINNRIAVVHGVNLDQLGVRDPAIYGPGTLMDLEVKVKHWAQEIGLEPVFEQTNHEGEFCELLHEARTTADGLLLNPGAWTHYSYAIRDAIEVTGLPAIEVHISNIEGREEWRAHSVIRDVVAGHVQGKGVDGYKEALEMLKGALS